MMETGFEDEHEALRDRTLVRATAEEMRLAIRFDEIETEKRRVALSEARTKLLTSSLKYIGGIIVLAMTLFGLYLHIPYAGWGLALAFIIMMN